MHQEYRASILFLPVQSNCNVMEKRIHRDQLNTFSDVPCLTHFVNPAQALHSKTKNYMSKVDKVNDWI